ncbi:MAG: IclR family transcriptional regulator [Alcaligenaceae bacterium]|nr:MAG: IclR family transcriptional regulator [Alcaligenaceae bacterium]
MDQKRTVAITAKPGVPIVRALDRGIALLKAFDIAIPRRTLTDLSHRAALDKGTTRRLLHTLEQAGLIDHDPITGLYSLGVGVLELASAVETGRELREVAAPLMSELSERTGTTAYLWVHHEGSALCVERVRAAIPNVDAAWFTVGSRAPLNSGGGPRALLAFISQDEMTRALSCDLASRTGSSQTDPARLMLEAARIREQGWELAVDDFVVGLAAIGVPIFDRDKTLVGSLSITTLTAQLVDDGTPRYLDLVKTCANEIGAKIFGRSSRR